MNKIILVEDENQVALSFKRMLESEGYNVQIAANSEEFFESFDSYDPDLILMDIELKNSVMNGLEIFHEIKRIENLKAKVIVLSARATRTQVAEAIKMGAVNFMEKGPYFKREKFLADVRQTLELSRRQEEINQLKLTNLDQVFIGNSPDMQRIKRKILKLAQTDLNVLLTGQTGTGKGIAAEILHLNSKRKNKPFKLIDIKSIPDSLIESELFGHTKGSFTGASIDKKGYFENADGGTLFIDEISNLNLSEQAKLLKVIEDKEIPIVGSGGKKKSVDVRIIAASNQNLAELASRNLFRNDLYFRLSVSMIHIPPLRKRKEDILTLMQRFLLDGSRENKNSLDIDLYAIENELIDYSWPGNVREIKNFATYISKIHDIIDNEIIISEFEMHKKRNEKLASVSADTVETNKGDLNKVIINPDYKETMVLLERAYLLKQLQLNEGNVQKTATSMNIDRTSLYKKMKKLNIPLDS